MEVELVVLTLSLVVVLFVRASGKNFALESPIVVAVEELLDCCLGTGGRLVYEKSVDAMD